MAHFPDLPSAKSVHIRALLREGSDQQTVVRLAVEEWLRGCDAHRKMEETGL